MTHHFHYRLTLENLKIASLLLKDASGLFVSVKGFQKPITTKFLSKLYIIKHRANIIYVGITSQGFGSRLWYGLKAQGRGGYHGYHWKGLKGDIDLLLWCFPDEQLAYLQAIEAEVVYCVRRNTGLWPTHQTEIHFHNVTDKEKKLAEQIYNDAAGM